MRAWVAIAVLALAALVAVIVLRSLGREDAVTVDGTTLSHSVARVVRGDSQLAEVPAPCRRGRRFQYSCLVPGTPGGGGAVYRVRLTGDGCWNAVKMFRGADAEEFPPRVAGCVKEVDQPD